MIWSVFCAMIPVTNHNRVNLVIVEVQLIWRSRFVSIQYRGRWDTQCVSPSLRHNFCRWLGANLTPYHQQPRRLVCDYTVTLHKVDHWNGYVIFTKGSSQLGYTESCHFQHFQCTQWLKVGQHDNMYVSVYMRYNKKANYRERSRGRQPYDFFVIAEFGF